MNDTKIQQFLGLTVVYKAQTHSTCALWTRQGPFLMLYFCWCVILHNKYRFRKGRLNDTNIVNGVVIFFISG